MKILSLLWMASLAMLLYACQKEHIQETSTDKKEDPRKLTPPDYFKLPPNGQYVTLEFANGKKLTLYKVDTTYLLDWDIALSPAQVELLKLINNGNARTYITDLVKHWPQGVIPYTFNSNITNGSQNTILLAMSDWESLVAGLDFVPRTNQSNYIEFEASNTNSSPVGMNGSKHVIKLNQGTSGVGLTSTTHEIGHAIGLFHEQSRTDRGNFININWSNIKPGVVHNFQTYAERGIPGTQFGTFDFNSIMLYPSLITDADFVYNTTINTMTRLNGTDWGTNFWLSNGDVEAASIIYGPPFVKIHYIQTSYIQEYGTVNEWEREEGGYVVSFFADRGCTIPFTLTQSKTIHYYVYSSGYTGGLLQSVTLDPGQDTYALPVSYFYEYRSEYGNITHYILQGAVSPGPEPFWKGWY